MGGRGFSSILVTIPEGRSLLKLLIFPLFTDDTDILNEEADPVIDCEVAGAA